MKMVKVLLKSSKQSEFIKFVKIIDKFIVSKGYKTSKELKYEDNFDTLILDNINSIIKGFSLEGAKDKIKKFCAELSDLLKDNFKLNFIEDKSFEDKIMLMNDNYIIYVGYNINDFEYKPFLVWVEISFNKDKNE